MGDWYLLCKDEDLSSNPQHSCKKAVHLQTQCHGVQTAELLVLARHISGSVRDRLKRIKD